VGLSSALHTGLSFFGHPTAAPPDPLYGEVRPVAPGRGLQLFHVLQGSRDDLGSLYTPAVLVFAQGDYGDPGPDCVPFGPSLISLFGLLGITMLTSVHLV